MGLYDEYSDNRGIQFKKEVQAFFFCIYFFFFYTFKVLKFRELTRTDLAQ